MQSIEIRAAEAEQFWQQGDAAQARGELEAAYQAFTRAHDLVTDCAKLHIRAHRKLLAVNRLRGDSERFTDAILLALAPFGMFELLAFVFRSRVGGSELCRRTAH